MPSKDDILAALAAVPGPDGKTPLPQIGRHRRRDRARRQGVRRHQDRSRARQGDGSHARGRRSQDQGAARRRRRAGDADRRERGPRRRAAPARPRIGAAAQTRGRSPASTRSSRSPPARAASASRPPPAISRSASPRLGLKVGVLDADVFGPSMPRLFGIARAARSRARRPEAQAAGEVRRQGDVDRLPGRGGRGDRLARADGDVGADPVPARSRLGRTRRARRRHAAGHRRRATDDGAERAAVRRGDRLDAAGPVADRRAARHRHVQAGRRCRCSAWSRT